ALQMSHMQVRDIIVPRPQMAVVKADQSTTEFMQTITETSHSRFPVIGESPDEVLGILLAKDLLPLAFAKQMDDFDLNAMLRKPIFVPESKRLSILLNEFRTNRYHMAIVLDEYGGVAGLVTIEDVLEQIVGEIEDETDAEEDDSNIRPFADNGFLVKALTSIEDFNDHFGTYYDDTEFDTIGGIVTQQFGHLPAKDEDTEIGSLSFRILAADNRRIRLMQVTPIVEESDDTDAQD
ncbi:MAG TPA: CBS domain-containing protein, partial [Oceanospirillaceae bacterium]|nr:CBS domain-containing protein [Oceanospirillaceae bacterium]